VPEGRPAPAIDAVFFDIGNVLLRFDAKKVVAKIAWEVRRNPLRIARYLMDAQAVDRVERGKLSADDLYRMFQLELGYRGTFPQFRKLWCDHFTLDRANFALLQRIAKDRKVYLLSNTNALHYDYICERYAFPKHVHGAILSHEVGLRKPEAAIYQAAVKLAGVPAERCLFIDDLKANVEGARKCGWQAIHHAKGHDLRAALADLGLP
jgi:putative hydrolase of the HAD superfamily